MYNHAAYFFLKTCKNRTKTPLFLFISHKKIYKISSLIFGIHLVMKQLATHKNLVNNFTIQKNKKSFLRMRDFSINLIRNHRSVVYAISKLSCNSVALVFLNVIKKQRNRNIFPSPLKPIRHTEFAFFYLKYCGDSNLIGNMTLVIISL